MFCKNQTKRKDEMQDEMNRVENGRKLYKKKQKKNILLLCSFKIPK